MVADIFLKKPLETADSYIFFMLSICKWVKIFPCVFTGFRKWNIDSIYMWIMTMANDGYLLDALEDFNLLSWTDRIRF